MTAFTKTSVHAGSWMSSQYYAHDNDRLENSLRIFGPYCHPCYFCNSACNAVGVYSRMVADCREGLTDRRVLLASQSG